MKTRTLLLGGLLASAAAAPALGQGLYAGASAGQSDIDASGFDEETGWKLYGGYRFNEMFAGQVGYINLGDFDGPGGGSVEVDGFEFSGVGRVPLTPQMNVFGKLGAYAWNADADAGLAVADDDDIDATYGIGGEYMFANNMGVRLELERFNDVGGEDIDLISAGVTLDF